ncbi:MAG: hypothetical protein HJJLKODD_01489 [Phycisphaerae bacterium]|nr:hypothetical protein [Phycisphaerae bacterium]
MNVRRFASLVALVGMLVPMTGCWNSLAGNIWLGFGTSLGSLPGNIVAGYVANLLGLPTG